MPEYDRKRKTWRTSICLGGKRITKRGFLTREMAELWIAQNRIEYQKGSLGFETPKQVEVLSILDNYQAHVREYKTPGSADSDKTCLDHWRKFFEKKSWSHTLEIPEDCAYQYLEWRREQNTHYGKQPADRTLELELGTARRAFDLAMERGMIKKNPLARLPKLRKKKPGIPRYLSLEEIKTIEENAPRLCKSHSNLKYFFQAFSVLVRTGMRSGELCSLELRDLDLPRGQILLRPEVTKAGRQRAVPVHGKAREIIEELTEEATKNGRQYLFATGAGSRQSQRNLNRRFRNILNKLEKEGRMHDTKPVHIHSLRSTFISHMIMAGADPVRVMAIVGHQEWATMRRYLALSNQYVTEGNELPY